MLENYAIHWLDSDSEYACRSAFAVNFCFEAFRHTPVSLWNFQVRFIISIFILDALVWSCVGPAIYRLVFIKLWSVLLLIFQFCRSEFLFSAMILSTMRVRIVLVPNRIVFKIVFWSFENQIQGFELATEYRRVRIDEINQSTIHVFRWAQSLSC